GQLDDGEQIAVKRLLRSRTFGQEPTIISKLQHKNVVRLFGCCTERNERLLIFELRLNRSLND
ncbi:hypothetical protein Ddye_019591, partial [Dipteronia dyeriana]